MDEPGDSAARDPRGPIHREIPDGDEAERLVCRDCGFIHYVNPKVVTGAVATWTDGAEEKVLLCRRAIGPRDGYWTLPAGYLELGESTEDGAKREAREEANAVIEIDRLLAVYNVTRISQVQTIYRARLVRADVSPGVESREVALFGPEALPWDELAFPTVHWALRHYLAVRGRDDFPPFSNPAGETADLD